MSVGSMRVGGPSHARSLARSIECSPEDVSFRRESRKSLEKRIDTTLQEFVALVAARFDAICDWILSNSKFRAAGSACVIITRAY